MTEIVITGWVVGTDKIGATNVLRKYTGVRLAAAKDVVDRVLAGESVVVKVEDAEGFLNASSMCGLVCSQLEDS